MRKFLLSFVVLMLVAVVILSASSTTLFISGGGQTTISVQPSPSAVEGKRTVDLMADDAYYISKGDSTLFILVGNFAAHHNGAVIMADSAVRYSNQSFECFGNVLINQNDTYVYGNRAEYNNESCVATVYSDLVKIVDGDATMYTYNCEFNTETEVGEFWGGCFVEKGESLMESNRGIYNTKTHDLTAIDRVEMRDDKYQMRGDSVIFNLETENAQYFTNSNIWSDNDEYLFADAGSYTKANDLHHLTRNAYILTPEREVWSDSIEYYRTEGHIIGRRNIQVDETEQKIMGFADYGEWWDEPGNALFTGRPSMINYDPQQSDSIFLSADTLWIYTIPVLPPVVEADSLSVGSDVASSEGDENVTSEDVPVEGEKGEKDERSREERKAEREERREERKAEREERREERRGKGGDLEEGVGPDMLPDDKPMEQGIDRKQGADRKAEGELKPESDKSGKQDPAKFESQVAEHSPLGDKGAPKSAPKGEAMADNEAMAPLVGSENARNDSDMVAQDSTILDTMVQDSLMEDSLMEDVLVQDSLAQDSLAQDSLAQDSLKALTPKQLRKIERRRQRDSIRAIRTAKRDSIASIKRAERDSIRAIRDSIIDIKVDSLIAKRKERSARIADEEKAHMERVQQRVQAHQRRKIDRAKARAARRGKEYKGPEYEDVVAEETTPADSLSMGSREGLNEGVADSMAMGRDSMIVESSDSAPEFPADSSYKMIKAYRNVRMYRSDSQIACDSMVVLNTDSILRLYQRPVLWNESNQVVSDSMAIFTREQKIERIHFMGNPIMGGEIDTMYYNQVKGRDMMAHFADGKVVRNDVEGNAQTIYFMQEEDVPDVTGLMYIESASITFYFDDGTIDQIVYKQNPEYVLYPLALIPETQERRLPNFKWHYELRPTRDSVMTRSVRPSEREGSRAQDKPRFRITDRINYDRRRLTENGVWIDRVDVLPPEIIEWRDSRQSYKQRNR